jgi:hypothetical protein
MLVIPLIYIYISLAVWLGGAALIWLVIRLCSGDSVSGCAVLVWPFFVIYFIMLFFVACAFWIRGKPLV